ncbi:polyphosphate kinase [Liquorilactobacillus sucicola DSM 21376 = JCM 15457]|uniref:Polyphosphate kinase n=1 Tax=Liquorilactobacillus sucicola DSM 21376 = JCM 15457 TaxID=1423806 RepID=A0A023CVZ4_9LACO|nr:RNA degradosome polyphosphate kinase [Liquorilactobacillus sucicola]KRN06153.1 polyphosphate kinase [Liquorilactobacillus sucicola DSM 21376 = JCM 15457]GAJ26078.1 polyphosphate kinase [Liquorilactobacillus sucicola DSM 21376 = JCM 15457]
MKKSEFNKHKYFKNRELSWLDFNGRVLEEARDIDNPLLERVNFLGITQSNVDEFFMVRVASLNKMYSVNIQSTDASGMTPKQQIDAINEQEQKMVAKRYTTYNRSLLPQLEKNNIRIITPQEANDEQYKFIKRYFNDDLYPVLTPLADDSSRPFPFISNNSLNLAVRIHESDNQNNKRFATIRIPEVFGRIIKLPNSDNTFILIEDIIKEFVENLFSGYKVSEVAAYRVIRDMDLDVAEEDTSDLLREVQKQLKKREHGGIMRFEIENTMGSHLRERLIKTLDADKKAVYRINGPVDLTFLKKLPRLVSGHQELRYPPYNSYIDPKLAPGKNIFTAIRQHDYFMQHPYDSFSSVVQFIAQAASDPNTLAIKMTLYRVSGNSPIIKYLGLAAQHGKQVTVLVEVKARFDEENNVRWAKQLEKMGCHVIYGLVGLKTHCKLALVIRRDEDGIRRYMHLGTGNYNDVTANFYTDMGILTANPDMGIDASNIFNMLSGYAKPPYFHKLHISPKKIRSFINKKIDVEIDAAEKGQPAAIKMKMNSLSDQKIIEKLYQASAAGVKIDLIVRGICCLKTMIPNVSENIHVHSIIGRFLEHSRIYYFYNGGNEDVYLSSADMMTRNLNRRVELLFPVLQDNLRQKVISIFSTMWQDNIKTRVLRGEQFEKLDRRGLTPLNAQEHFVQEAQQKNKLLLKQKHDAKRDASVFHPMTRHESMVHLSGDKEDE